jgi:glycosyltransferase involved in cell wall biosynthesis
MNSYNKKSNKPSICFVSPDNFAALVDDPKYGRIGGAEVQQMLIGKELAKRGHRVSFITFDHGQDDKLEIDGMHIIKAYNENVGIPALRFVHPRLTRLWHAMKTANADIYYQRTSDSITGIVAAFCRHAHRKFVFSIACDYDCMADLPYFATRHARVLYRYGLRRASLVIAQTVTQQKLLHENFNVNSTVIPNCVLDYGHCYNGTVVTTSARKKRLLWIGGFTPVKRLELLLDVAEQNQDLQFDVVGDGDRQSDYVQRLRSRAKTIPNIHLHGRIPHGNIPPFYQQTDALICTSLVEGFPNIFLEAWSHGIPVFSTFDPDNLIAKEGLGKTGKDVSELATGIRELLDSTDQWRNASKSAREYFRQNHSVDKALEQYERVFYDLVSFKNNNNNGDSL